MRLQFVILLCIALVVPPPASADPSEDGEDELKSATVLSFLRYSTWPDLPGTKEPLTVGVLGRASFGRVLAAGLSGKTVNGRSVRLVHLASGDDPHCCQLIYFATSRKEEIYPWLQVAGTLPVLTLGETDKFLSYGGAVNLLLVDGHMGFEVNLQALKRSGVDISSRLLRLGQIKWNRGA